MRIIPTKTDIKFITYSILFFAVPFVTSFLLDVPVIEKSVMRTIIIYVLISAQFLVLAYKIYQLILNAQD